MQKWQHIGIYEPFDSSHQLMNSMGNAGWELVAVVSRNDEGDCYYFKRQREVDDGDGLYPDKGKGWIPGQS